MVLEMPALVNFQSIVKIHAICNFKGFKSYIAVFIMVKSGIFSYWRLWLRKTVTYILDSTDREHKNVGLNLVDNWASVYTTPS